MRTGGQVGQGLPVKSGQLMIPTECFCGARFTSPTRARKHLDKQHPKKEK